jgi:DNA-directed RNA polymerase subunit RPC12/RpoP
MAKTRQTECRHCGRIFGSTSTPSLSDTIETKYITCTACKNAGQSPTGSDEGSYVDKGCFGIGCIVPLFFIFSVPIIVSFLI